MLKFAIYTLGCKVNAYESEAVTRLFLQAGFQLVDFKEKADIYVINTCTVTNTSDSKSRQKIRAAVKRNKDAIICVMGCYAQMAKDEVSKIEGVDIVIGTSERENLVEMVQEYLKEKKKIVHFNNMNVFRSFDNLSVETFTQTTRAFIKIQDGCNNFCSYCIIPYARGRVRSLPFAKVIADVKKMTDNGYKEVVLTGIHTGQYGTDLGNTNLTDLIKELIKIEKLERLRISSIELSEITEEMLDLIANNDKIAKHLHIPLQSGCNETLKRMNRKYLVEDFKAKVDYIRNKVPNISITTDVIVGFPGEDDNEFRQTCEFIKIIRFSYMHIFPYSKRDLTVASTMENQVSENVKKERVKELMNLNSQLSLSFNQANENEVVEVLFETNHDGVYSGHSSNFILVKTTSDQNDLSGKIKKVKIIKAHEFECVGELYED